MKGYNHWNYEHFLPAFELEKQGNPYISRLVPAEDAVSVETDRTEGTVYYKKRQGGKWNSCVFAEKKFQITGLEKRCEYQIYIRGIDEKESSVRLFRTGKIFGTPVVYHHPEDRKYAFSGRFLGSPSLVKLPNGVLIASCDWFDLRTPQNLTRLFRSEDQGKTWSFVCELMPCFWGTLFLHKGDLYMLAMSTEYGDLLIGRSEDEGYTWTTPTVILRGQVHSGNGCHRSACKILRKDGRLFTSLEFGAWAYDGFYNAVLSISEEDDLLDAANWTISDFVKEKNMSGIEGSVVEAPDGEILNILRWRENEAIVMTLSRNYEHLTFEKTIPFPLAHTKFQIEKHENGLYYALGNTAPQRNVLALYRSADLMEWELVKNVVDCSDCDKENTGFQYPYFLFEGDEILILSRTAYNGADNFHNSNYITFHRTGI